MVSWCFNGMLSDGEVLCHLGGALKTGVGTHSTSNVQDQYSCLQSSQAYSNRALIVSWLPTHLGRTRFAWRRQMTLWMPCSTNAASDLWVHPAIRDEQYSRFKPKAATPS